MRKLYETWVPVKGFESVYQINNWGDCKSVARFRKGKNGSLVPVPEKILKGKKDKDGYIEYALCTGEHKSMKYFRAHRLVAEAFIPNPDGLPLINHINGNRDCNLVDNLEWVDAKANRDTTKVRNPVIYNEVWFESMRELARYLDTDISNVRRSLANHWKIKGHYVIEVSST